MVKNIFKTLLKILIIMIAYLLQIYVVNNTTFFGVKGDLCLMTVVLITLMEKNYTSYITAAICGIISDALFSTIACKYLIIYLIVVSVLVGLKKMYKQDSKLSIIVFSVAGVIISELLLSVFYLFSTGNFINIFTFIFNLFKQCIINICFAFIIFLCLRLTLREGE